MMKLKRAQARPHALTPDRRAARQALLASPFVRPEPPIKLSLPSRAEREASDQEPDSDDR